MFHCSLTFQLWVIFRLELNTISYYKRRNHKFIISYYERRNHNLSMLLSDFITHSKSSQMRIIYLETDLLLLSRGNSSRPSSPRYSMIILYCLTVWTALGPLKLLEVFSMSISLHKFGKGPQNGNDSLWGKR